MSSGRVSLSGKNNGQDFHGAVPRRQKAIRRRFFLKKARAFYDQTILLKRYLNVSSGVSPDSGTDEYFIDAETFMAFLVRFWVEGFLCEKRGGMFHSWARFAAGMIKNITLINRTWIDRRGEVLEAHRYRRPSENESGQFNERREAIV